MAHTRANTPPLRQSRAVSPRFATARESGSLSSRRANGGPCWSEETKRPLKTTSAVSAKSQEDKPCGSKCGHFPKDVSVSKSHSESQCYGGSQVARQQAATPAAATKGTDAKPGTVKNVSRVTPQHLRSQISRRAQDLVQRHGRQPGVKPVAEAHTFYTKVAASDACLTPLVALELMGVAAKLGVHPGTPWLDARAKRVVGGSPEERQFGASAAANGICACHQLCYSNMVLLQMLLEEINRCMASLDPHTAAKLLWNMAMLKLGDKWLMAALMDRIADDAGVGSLSSNLCVKVLAGCAAAQVTSGRLLRYICTNLRRCIDELTPNQIGTVYLSLGKLEIETVLTPREHELADDEGRSLSVNDPKAIELCKKLMSRFSEFTLSSIAKFLYGCAKLQWKPLEVLASAVKSLMEIKGEIQFGSDAPADVALLMEALGDLGLVEEVKAIAKVSFPLHEDFKIKEFLEIYKALAKLKIVSTAFTPQSSVPPASAGDEAETQTPHSTETGSTTASDAPPPRFDSIGSANMLPEITDRLVAVVAEFTTHQAANFMSYCGILQWQPPLVVQTAVRVIALQGGLEPWSENCLTGAECCLLISTSLSVLEGLDVYRICDIIATNTLPPQEAPLLGHTYAALASADHKPPALFPGADSEGFEKALVALDLALPHYNAEELAKHFWACATLDWPFGITAKALELVCAKSEQNELNENTLPDLLWACARLDLDNPQLSEVLTSGLVVFLDDMDSVGVARCLWACTKLDCAHETIINAVIQGRHDVQAIKALYRGMAAPSSLPLSSEDVSTRSELDEAYVSLFDYGSQVCWC